MANHPALWRVLTSIAVALAVAGVSNAAAQTAASRRNAEPTLRTDSVLFFGGVFSKGNLQESLTRSTRTSATIWSAPPMHATSGPSSGDSISATTAVRRNSGWVRLFATAASRLAMLLFWRQPWCWDSAPSPRRSASRATARPSTTAARASCFVSLRNSRSAPPPRGILNWCTAFTTALAPVRHDRRLERGFERACVRSALVPLEPWRLETGDGRARTCDMLPP